MAVSPKVIYLEIDEEVTSVIDKIRKTEFTDVILVVPKDASISQSVVNLKLIKRKAEELNKNVSLATQDKVARNLAGKVGIPSAAKIDEIPKIESVGTKESPVKFAEIEEKGPLAETSEVIFDKESVQPEPEELTVVEGEDVLDEVEMHEDVDEKLAKASKNLMPKFPWKWVLLIGALVLGGLLVAGYVYVPRTKATIYVTADKETLNINFSGKKDATLDTDRSVIPTQVLEVSEEKTATYSATGTKEVGEKATGTITVSNISGHSVTIARVVPEGSSSLVFIADASTTVTNGTIATVTVTAQNVGEDYNGFASTTFNPSSGAVTGLTILSTSSGMTGGSQRQINVVTQEDIDTATETLTQEIENSITSNFNNQANDVKIIDDTKEVAVTSAVANPNVDAEATEFTLTIKMTAKAIGFSMNDVQSLVTAEVERKLGYSKTIISNGSESAEIGLDSSDLTTGEIYGTIKTIAFVSTKINEDAVRVELIGLSDSAAQEYLTGLDGVESARIEYWPSFFKNFPRLKTHIYLSVDVAESSKD